MSNFFSDNAHVIFGSLAVLFGGAAVAGGIYAARKSAEAKAEAYEESLKLEDNLEDLGDSPSDTEIAEIAKLKNDIKKKQIVKTIAWYSIPAVCEVASITFIFLGQKNLIDKNNLLLDQNSQLTANLTAVAGSLAKQQKVFKEALGEADYREIANRVKTEQIETTDAKGKAKKANVKVVEKDAIEDSSFIFGPYKANGDINPKWSANIEDNYAYVDNMSEFFNDQLNRKPVIFRNQVVEYFDDSFEAQTEYGQYFGKTASMRSPVEPDIRLAATEYMMRDPHGNLVDCLLVQSNLNQSVAQYLK